MTFDVREHKRSLIFLSAFLYVVSFYGFWITIFFFLIPLLVLITKKIPLYFSDGMLWGFTFFGLHWISFWYVIYWQGSGAVRFLFLIILLLYGSLYAGFWFVSCSWATRNYGLIGWTVSTVFYFYIIDTFLLWPFGILQGYPLSFIVTPLCYCPQLLTALIYCNKWVLVSCLISVHYCVAQKKICLSLFFLIPFLIGPLLDQSKENPEWIKKIQFIFPPKTIDTEERMYHAIKECSTQKDAILFVLPESYFATYLTSESYLIKTLHDNCLQKKQTMLFGSGIEKEGKFYNAVFLVQYCRIIQTYEKSHLIPFFEYNPYQNNQIGIFTHFFFHKGTPFTCAYFCPKVWFAESIGHFIPVICSELFWQSRTNYFPGLPLICCMNDSYFGPFGFQRIMLLNAQLVAILEKRFLAYCGSNQAYIINPDGIILKHF